MHLVHYGGGRGDVGLAALKLFSPGRPQSTQHELHGTKKAELAVREVELLRQGLAVTADLGGCVFLFLFFLKGGLVWFGKWKKKKKRKEKKKKLQIQHSSSKEWW